MSKRKDLIKEIMTITDNPCNVDCRKTLESLQTYHSIVYEKTSIVLAFRFLLADRCALNEEDFMKLYNTLERKL